MRHWRQVLLIVGGLLTATSLSACCGPWGGGFCGWHHGGGHGGGWGGPGHGP